MNILEIKDFGFRYPNAEKEALTDVSMTFERGSLTVLCGKSGCGKSTLLRQLKTVLAPYGTRRGQILYKGQDLKAVDQRTQSSAIGYVLQDPDAQIVTDKVWHELAFGLESLGFDTPTIRLRVAEMASYFGIHEWFYKNVTELSGGQKQLLNLASVMAMHPEILILDEPTSQLDPIAASDFLETVEKINRDIGTTVILTEHRLEDIIPKAGRIYVMDEGRVIAGGRPSEIGQVLRDSRHDMFLAMPASMQIYAATKSPRSCPLTVREGREWLEAELADHSVQGPAVSEKEKAEPEADKEKKEEVPVIDCRDVWFRYERDLPDVVKGLDLKVRRGEIFAVVGGNGTGKSTSLGLIAGLRSPYRGKIYLDGREIRKYSNEELYHGFLGVMPQNPQSLFVKKTVRDDLYEAIDGPAEKKSPAYPIDMKKETAVEGIASLTHLEDLLDRHPYDLSGGEQQRLALAKILLLRPKILLMDEPTKGLDNHFKKELGAILRKLAAHGMTVLIISHDVEFCAEFADRTGLFFQGGLVAAKETAEFFAGNHFYTTAANRIARSQFPKAVTAEGVIAALKEVCPEVCL